MNQKHLPKVKILKVGTLCLEASELASTFTLQLKSDLGIGGGSTVTLIEAERRILVDTGFDYEWLDTPSNGERNAKDLVRALRDHGIMPDDVDTIFITHWHKDHFGNLEVFRKAGRLASKGMVHRFELEGFVGIDDQDKIADGVKMMLTPGHTIDHASIIVDSEVGDIKARVAIAGDAVVSHSYFQAGRIWQYNADFYNVEAARESVLRLMDVSDIIIPGHGVPFMSYKPAWAKLSSQ
jgi:N-acyl homoserine lactone hydrolase